ncbi:MAG: NAD(P)/FAD-dependent oxidoreductase [Deltaproteobacteria bacterium]
MIDFQVIVIGSGAGGLSAALFLAKQGFSVLLLEAMPSFGGYLNPFRRGPYTFDTGVHYLGELGRGEAFANLLDTLGIEDKLDFVELDPEGIDRFVFPDYEFTMCKGKERYKEKLIGNFPKEENGIKKYFSVLDKVTKATEASMSSGAGPLGMLGFLLKHPVMLKYGRATYQKLLDEVTTDKLLQAVLSAHSATYGLPPAKASVLTSLLVLNHFVNGAYYPKGGSGAFRDAFFVALQGHGAQTKRLKKVVGIEKKAGEFFVKIDSGEQYTAKAVVSNADPVLTLGRLVDPDIIPSKIRERVSHLRPSLGAFYAFIGTDLDLPSLGITAANIYHYGDIDINKAYDTADASLIQENVRDLFITSPSVKDPEGGHAPQGRHTIEIITWGGYDRFKKWAGSPSMKRGDDYMAFKDRIGNSMVKAAEKHIPNLSGHLDHVEYATPLSNEYWVNAVRGASYGLEHTPDQIGQGRFGSFTAGIEGLFLVGAGTLGAGVLTCVASGVLAGGKVAEYLESLR